ncbi:MAG TPA: TIGR03790 family protein [Candidatus Acidoferrales bacterium]|nr:TIGR03790 family protein [Candidatus Acidoferrales bacterium]
MLRWTLLLLLVPGEVAVLHAQTGANLLLVVNGSVPLSRQIADYYRPRRSVPVTNVCVISTTGEEEIPWSVYEEQIERPVGDCLKKNGLTEKVLYIVTTMGVPLKVDGAGSGMQAEHASVDSELTLLYSKLKGGNYQRAGGVPNPFFMKRDATFGHPQFPIYLVTRLAAYDFADVKGMIDRSLAARNRGKFVIDLNSPNPEPGNNWLRNAALLLPKDRVVLDATAEVLYNQTDVIAYASWGSNDDNRKQRRLRFQWLPGAIAAEYVSTSARTMKRPPDTWTYTTWEDKQHFYAGSPQGLVADLIHEGASGASGNTYEPYLAGCARPDYVLPAYFEGRNLAESFYLSLIYLSWQAVVLGDPLMALGKP